MILFMGTSLAFDVDEVSREQVLRAGKSRVEVVFPAGTSLGEALVTVISPAGVWARQSPDAAPLWVASDSALLAALLGEHYGCEVREPVAAGERGEHAERFPTAAAAQSVEG